MFRNIARNTGINFIAKIIATILGLAAVVLMTRYLGALGFGQYTIIITYLQFFGLVADMGLTLIAAQMLARYDDEQNVMRNLFTFRLVSAGVFLGLAPLIVIFMPYAWPVKVGVFIATASFFFIALNQVFIGFYQKHLLMVRASLSEIGGRVMLVAGIGAAVALDGGLQGVVVATTLSSLAHLAINYGFSRNYFRLRLSFNPVLWREIMRLSWPIAITITFNIIYLRADTLVLSFLQSETVVGIYGAAYRVIDVLVALPFILAGLALPQLTRALKDSDKEQFKFIMQHSFDLMVIIALPLMVGTQFVAAPLMALVAGGEFAPSGAVLQLLILACGIIYLGVIFSHAIIAIEKQKQTIWAYVLVALTALAGYLVFIPRYSYFGAAAVTIYSEVMIALLIFGITYHYTKFIPSPAVFFKSLTACAVMALVLYYTQGYLLVSLTVGTLVYAAVFYAIARNNLKTMLRS